MGGPHAARTTEHGARPSGGCADPGLNQSAGSVVQAPRASDRGRRLARFRSGLQETRFTPQLLQRLKLDVVTIAPGHGAPAGPVFRSLRLSFERIKGGEGRPLEALDSIRGLSDTLEAYGQGVTDYERSRFQLLMALGMPPAGFIDPSKMPLPCVPPDTGSVQP